MCMQCVEDGCKLQGSMEEDQPVLAPLQLMGEQWHHMDMHDTAVVGAFAHLECGLCTAKSST